MLLLKSSVVLTCQTSFSNLTLNEQVNYFGSIMKKPAKKYNKNLLFKYSFLIIILTVLCSCVSSHQSMQGSDGKNTIDLSGYISKKIDLLQSDLETLSTNIDITEARQLAETSISYSLLLADKYRLIWPPYLHNILVRVGIRDRGLCYHWTEDLMKRLASLELKSFHLHQGVAHKGSDLREHNSVVVTAMGQNFSDGIVLDPWRNSGDLYWARVKEDRYPWVER